VLEIVFKSPTLNSTALKSRSNNTTVIPGGMYPHVRVYANGRLRRIWFGEGDSTQKVPWLYSVRRFVFDSIMMKNVQRLSIQVILYLTVQEMDSIEIAKKALDGFQG